MRKKKSTDWVNDGKVLRAIEVLKMFCKGRKVMCAFSGGKDSQVCYHLLKMAEIPFVARLSITRFEPPEALAFVREHYPDVEITRRYKMSLVEEIAYRGLPNRWCRWCCSTKHIRHPDIDIAVVGVRWAESFRRANNWRQFGKSESGEYYVAPICDWSEEEVWDFLNKRGLPHCKLYDEGFPRIGCICCPLANKASRIRDIRRYPKHIAMLKTGARKFVERRAANGFMTSAGKSCPSWSKAENPLEEYWKRWILTAQTGKAVNEVVADEKKLEQCVFEGSGYSALDGREEVEVEVI